MTQKSKKRKHQPSPGVVHPNKSRSKSGTAGWLWGAGLIVVSLGLVVWLNSGPPPQNQVPDARPAMPGQSNSLPIPELVRPPATSNAISTVPPPAPAPVEAVTTNTNDPNAFVERMNLANRFLSEGKFTNALQLLQEAVKIAPDDEDVHYNLGIALSRLGRNAEAIKEYEEALRLLPDYAEAHNNLGNLLNRLGKTDEAIKHFEDAVRITPDYASGWNNLGSALEKVGRTNEASADFRKAVELDTNYWQARFNLGASLLQQKRFDEARAEFQAVQKLEPTFGPVKAALERVDKEQTASTNPPASH